MVKKIKFSKIMIVIFITVLIWVWADLALDETLPDKSAVVVVDESVARQFWISFNQSPSADVKITLSGPHSAVTTMDMELRKRQQPLEFVFNAVQEQMDRPGVHSLKVLEFLRKDRELRRRGLIVQSCDPNELSVNVVKLDKKPLVVECFDASGNPLKTQSIDPPEVPAFVPADSRLTAKVKLNKAEIELARKVSIKKNPYVELAPEYVRESATPVEIKLAPEEDPLSKFTINATYSIAFSPNIQGKYRVEITNLPQLLSPIAVRATNEAQRAYENQQLPQMTLYIFDDDVKKDQEDQHKTVHYNFPEKFVRTGEIQLDQEPATADFKLIPLPSAENE